MLRIERLICGCIILRYRSNLIPKPDNAKEESNASIEKVEGGPAMTLSASRLTCFALLSAIEEDLRAVAAAELGGHDAREVLADSYKVAVERLIREVGQSDEPFSIQDLLPFIDFAEAFQLLARNYASLPDPYADYLRGVAGRLKRLEPIRNRVAHTRPLDYEDFATTIDTANDLARDRRFPWTVLRETVARLAEDPSYVLGLEIRFPGQPEADERHNLPTPDYDETGFIGRGPVVANLKRVIKGAYPVISIVGDGGIGKSSLVLKVAYDMLDSGTFDSIVWISAQTALLTSTEIVRIVGAISDSLGMLSAAAWQMGGEAAADNPIEEVLAYLEHFRILLILETVLDETLRDFLGQLPQGSKVLITSRIGIGAYEYPVRLGPLEPPEGVRLLRALARLRNVEVLLHASDSTIARYVDLMGARPLYIRWFVSAIQAGSRPEDVLSNSSLLLDYCMSNVYNYLSDDGCVVLRALQAVPGLHSQADLAFLSDMSIHNLQNALLQLTNTYFVTLQSSSYRASPETLYQLTEFAIRYLDKHHPVSTRQRDELRLRNKSLYETGRRIRADYQANPYSHRTLDIRGEGDFGVARLLIDAISLIQRNRLVDANELIRGAKELAPGYHEVHRVEAFLRTQEGDYPGAISAYERARELEPDSVPLRYFFGTFLLGHGGDPEAGLTHLQYAARLQGNDPKLQLEIARAHLSMPNLSDARDVSANLLDQQEVPADLKRRAAEVMVQADVSLAHRAAEREDWAGAVGWLEDLIPALLYVMPTIAESTLRTRLDQARNLAGICQQRTTDDYVSRRAIETLSELSAATSLNLGEFEVQTYGRIVRMVPERSFGFIREVGAKNEYFFHRRDLTQNRDWPRCIEGCEVSFRADPEHARGPKALNVRVLGQ